MFRYIGYDPPFPFFPVYPTIHANCRFAYPAVDTKIFSKSVKAFSPLMQQGNRLLSHLNNPSFAHKLMDAAQHGRRAQVEALVKSIGLTAPVTTHYSPTGIIFTLHSRETPDPFENCCSLSFAIKWGH
jgi:hypothetical protein